MKKQDEVADDEDDDVARNSVSQGQVTVTLCHCVLKNCFSALNILYITLPTYKKG
jgi:hypothetical protein